MRLGLTSVLILSSAAAAQPWFPGFSFEPPEYVGSPQGVALAGQTGWKTPPGAPAGEWLVYTHEGDPFSLPPWGSGQFAASSEPAEAAIETTMSQEFTVVVAVQFPQGAVGDLGSIFFQPDVAPGKFSIHAVASTLEPACWHVEVTSSDNGGAAQRSPIPVSAFQELLPKKWYVLNFLVGYQNAVRDIWITDPATGERATFKPVGWYLPGGAGAWTGGTTVGLTAELAPGPGSVISIDDFHESWHCARSETDCDRDYVLTVFDFLCYQNAFVAQLQYADCEPDGELDLFDFLCFFNTFTTGCP